MTPVASAGSGTRCARDFQGSGCSNGQGSASVWSRTFPDSCKVQAGLWQCGHCVSAQAESRQPTCGHAVVGREPAGHNLPLTQGLAQPLLTPRGTQGSLQPHTDPWPELPSPPISSPTKLSWLLGTHATAIRAAQAPQSVLWTDPSTTAIPPYPQGHFGECSASAAMCQGWQWPHQAFWCPHPRLAQWGWALWAVGSCSPELHMQLGV